MHPPAKRQAWEQLNWPQCERNVSRLQARIVKATREGRWGKVKALQRLLTHSFSGKALAVKRVTENQGKRTSGVDGEDLGHSGDQISKPSARCDGAVINRNRCGVFTSRKPMGKLRPLGIPTMKDRAMQALYLLALEPIAETTGDLNSYGFRSKRSTADAIEQCVAWLCVARPAPRGCWKETFADVLTTSRTNGCSGTFPRTK